MLNAQLMRAISYATVKHEGQKRKVNKEPYIAHPYRVAMILKESNCEQELVIAGLLHDVIEDTDATIEEIEVLFGHRVAKIVDAVTEKPKDLSWEYRKQQSIDQVRHSSLDAKLVVCADKIDNLDSMINNEMTHGESMWFAFEKGKKEQQWYYQQMLESVTSGRNKEDYHPLMRQFETSVSKFLNL